MSDAGELCVCLQLLCCIILLARVRFDLNELKELIKKKQKR